PEQSEARYTVGRILAMQHRYTPEAVALLTQASADTPMARLTLAKVLQSRGEIDRAMGELRAYLQNPEPSRKARVEAWLEQVSQQRGRATVRIQDLPMENEAAQ